MAPPINPYQLMRKTFKEASSSKNKRKAKEGAQAKKSRRPIFEVIAPEQAAPSADLSSTVLEIQPQLPQIVEIDEPKEVANLAPRTKRARTVGEMTQHPRSSSSDDI